VGETCPEANLRTPTGAPLNLTGTWQADDFGTFSVAQRESCLHWLGMSPGFPDAGVPAGSWWTQVYVGEIGSDFGVRGEWSDVPYLYDYGSSEVPNSGELLLQIGFFEDDQGDERPTLHFVDVRGGDGYGGRNWVPMDAMPPIAEYEGTYRYEGSCPSVELNGQLYELVQFEYDFAEGGQLLDDGQVAARPGDPMRVEGQIWPDPDAEREGCQPLLFLAWEVEPLP
jgi:hypothetical protein